MGILDDVTRAVPAHFQRAGETIVLLWPIPRGERPDPDLKVPLNPPQISEFPMPLYDRDAYQAPKPDAAADTEAKALVAFGSSEYAKVILGGLWGKPPALDIAAEAALHKLLGEVAWRRLITSARDISDGGIAVALAQAAFPRHIGAAVEQDSSLLAHPLFGLFAEPATAVIVTAGHGQVSEIEKLAGEFGFFAARIGTTGGDRLRISVDREPFISAPLEDLRNPWAEALESYLQGEAPA